MLEYFLKRSGNVGKSYFFMAKWQKTWVSIRKQFKTHPNMMNSWPAGLDLTQNGSFTLKHQVSYYSSSSMYLITLKTAFQNILPCLNIPEFIVFLLKLNCSGSRRNKAEKTFFSFDLHTFCQKQTFCYTWPPFLNRRLLINGSFSRIITFHMANVKRVVLWLLFRPYGCILHPRFI